MIDADKLRALDAEATPGPWKVFALFGGGGPYEVCRAEDYAMGGVCVPTRKHDAELVAHLRNAVPDILALTEEVRVLREALEDIARDRFGASYSERWKVSLERRDIARAALASKGGEG